MLNIAYITARTNPRIEWFVDSLHRELDGQISDVRLIVVDLKKDERHLNIEFPNVVHINSKPCVWHGKHRLVSQDYFAASSSRNTALCHASDGFLAYADDLSILMPGWLSAVREGMAQNKIICGSYRKVRNLKVENGHVISFDEGADGCPNSPKGRDTRVNFAKSNPWPCDGGWLYGCSVAMPVEALLTINGWPEFVDGAGGEDCLCGIVLQNAGYQFIYDQRMLTLESEEAHHEDAPLKKDDWHYEGGVPVRGGNGKDDKSHAALNIALQSKHFPNYCDFRELRQTILNGGEFPIIQCPEHDWFTKILLKDL